MKAQESGENRVSMFVQYINEENIFTIKVSIDAHKSNKIVSKKLFQFQVDL